jgi:hypothetical protein
MQVKQIKDLQDPKYILVQDSQEVAAVLDSIGYRSEKEFQSSCGCLLVEVLEGEYGEVWAIDSYVPYLSETAYQIN